MKHKQVGKNQNMEKNRTGRLLETVQKNLTDNLTLKNIYSFQLKDRDVKVFFSDSPNAHTIEDALVKIATRRIS